MNAQQLKLTVLLIAGNRRERVANALASVLKQTLIDQIEVLVLECGDANPVPVPGQDHPRVRTVSFPAPVAAGRVRAEAVQMARGPIVAFLEEHAEAGPGWVEAILKAFDDNNWAAVGPEISNGSTSIGNSDALSLCYYPLSRFPAKRQELEWLPFHNTAYRREAVLEHRNELERLFSPEILLQWQLRRDGRHLLLEPECKITHYFEAGITSVWLQEVTLERVFIANWAELSHWPVWKHVVRACSTPLIPIVRPLKLLRIVLQYRRNMLGHYLLSLPFMIVSTYMAGAIGEFLGLIYGARDGDALNLKYSISDHRRLPADFPHYSLEKR